MFKFDYLQLVCYNLVKVDRKIHIISIKLKKIPKNNMHGA